VAHLEKAVALRPDYAAAHNNLGHMLLGLGRQDEAAASFRRALELMPTLVEAHGNLAGLLMRQGKTDEAARHFEQALALRPGLADAHNNLARIRWGQGRLDEGVAHLRQVIALRPDYAEAHNNLGNMLLRLNLLDLAAESFERAIALKPDFFQAHSGLGIVLHAQGRLDQAVAEYQRALELQPDLPETHDRLGSALARLGDLPGAEGHCRQALALAPKFAGAHNNLGSVLRMEGKFAEAAAEFEQALALEPGFFKAQVGAATCYLIQGDFQRGWPAYEARLKGPGFRRNHNLPRWSGERLSDKTLLLVAEQGLGDTIQFVRYARAFKAQGARIVLAVQPPLGRLLAGLPDVDELFLIDAGRIWPRADFHLPLLSAPAVLGTDEASIPRGVPYLAANPALADQWRGELAGLEAYTIGIAWQGARGCSLEPWRSIPLAQFRPLAELPGVRLVSLQKGFGVEQLATAEFPLVDFSNRMDGAAGPFVDSAAILASLDLVVTSDSAIAHLAGALGRPVWVALQFAPDWRWLLDRDDSPWYPTMRLFRQTTPDDWPEVFGRIAEAVQERRSTAS
jgi:tetratricopeptide (TPR) repeat protein